MKSPLRTSIPDQGRCGRRRYFAPAVKAQPPAQNACSDLSLNPGRPLTPADENSLSRLANVLDTPPPLFYVRAERHSSSPPAKDSSGKFGTPVPFNGSQASPSLPARELQPVNRTFISARLPHLAAEILLTRRASAASLSNKRAGSRASDHQVIPIQATLTAEEDL